MTYAICMIKGLPEKRERTREFLEKTSKTDSLKSIGVSVPSVFVSFGWPDFVVILEAENVELIKEAIVRLREDLQKNEEIEDTISTSTIICTTQEEINKKMEKFRS